MAVLLEERKSLDRAPADAKREVLVGTVLYRRS